MAATTRSKAKAKTKTKTRVKAKAKKPAAKPVVARNPELEAAIIARDKDDDDAPWLVYGDWLQEQNDPRGALSAIQRARAIKPKDKALEKAEAAMLDEHARMFLKGLEKYFKEHDQGPPLEVTWRHGFVTAARVRGTVYNTPPKLITDILGTLFEHPSCVLLEALTIGKPGYWQRPRSDGIVQDFSDVVSYLASHPNLPPIRRLFVGDFEYPDDMEMSWSSLGDLEPLLKRLSPKLRALRLRSGHMKVGRLALPNLRELVIETGAMTRETLGRVTKTDWPNLEKLELWLGSSKDYGGDVKDVCELASILDGSGFPRLRHLGLVNSELDDALYSAICSSPILKRLEVLDLSLGTMGATGADILMKNAKALKHLKRLDLRGNYLDSASIKRVKTLAAEVQPEEQRKSSRGYRYAAVTE